jgi:hypothetical protein
MDNPRLSGTLAACLLLLNLVAPATQAIPVSGQGTWETTLLPRDLDGDTSTYEAYYDTVLDITWWANAANTDLGNPGQLTWDAAMTWVAGLNIGGYTGWRLPVTNPIDGTTADDTLRAYNGSEDLGYNVSAPGTLYAGSTASELAHLFYNTLGNLGYCHPTLSTATSCSGPQSGYGLSNSGPFTGIAQNPGHIYWSATEWAPSTTLAWGFAMDYGEQDSVLKSNTGHIWIAHPGDVGVAIVPVPAAAWLFVGGLLALVVQARRQRPPV